MTSYRETAADGAVGELFNLIPVSQNSEFPRVISVSMDEIIHFRGKKAIMQNKKVLSKVKLFALE